MRKIFINFLILLIKIYKVLISPILSNNCRYFPTCSEYFIESFKNPWSNNGFCERFKRIFRCHPIKILGGGESGLDIVKKTRRKNMDNKNVFVAIALSMSVLLFWGAFVDTPKPVNQNNKKIENKNFNNNEITPNINPEKFVTKVSRKDALVKDDRIIIDNKKIYKVLYL